MIEIKPIDGDGSSYTQEQLAIIELQKEVEVLQFVCHTLTDVIKNIFDKVENQEQRIKLEGKIRECHSGMIKQLKEKVK